jgi:hypothetical protein
MESAAALCLLRERQRRAACGTGTADDTGLAAGFNIGTGTAIAPGRRLSRVFGLR